MNIIIILVGELLQAINRKKEREREIKWTQYKYDKLNNYKFSYLKS